MFAEGRSSRVGYWTFLGLVAILFGITVLGGVDYLDLAQDFVSFLGGNFDHRQALLLDTILIVIAVVLIDLAQALPISYFVRFLIGRAALNESAGRLFVIPLRWIFLLILFEEFSARFLFLGLLTKVFHGDVAFYVLMVVGNTIWSLIHLGNYRNKEDRSPLRVLSQFLGGFLYAYLFVRYGFWVTVLAHFTYDAVLLSAHKKFEVSVFDATQMVYWSIVGGIMAFLMWHEELSLATLLPWLTSNSIQSIAGLHFWDYVILLIAVQAIFLIVSHILFMDPIIVRRASVNPLLIMLFIPIMVGIIVGVNALLAVFMESLTARVLVIAILLTIVQETTSGSGIARAWFTSLPTSYLGLAALTTLGWLIGGELLFIFAVTSYIPTLVRVVWINEVAPELLDDE